MKYIRPAPRNLLVPLLAFGVSVGLAFALFAYTSDDVTRDAELRFERRAADAKHVIERRLHSYVGVTYGLRALFAARGELTRAEFSRYVRSLDLENSFPGFEVLNYARHIRGDQKRQLEEEVRSDTSLDPRGYPDFAIKPPGARPEYHVLVYLEPLQGNEFAMGLDIRMIGASGKGMEDLRRTDSIISSGRLLSVGKKRFVGLAMRLPVHRQGVPLATAEQRSAAFIGSVGAGYNVRKLMTGVLDKTTMKAIRYRLYDAGQTGDAAPERLVRSLLFDSAQIAAAVPEDHFAESGPQDSFHTVLPLELAGRTWELRFDAPRAAFMEGNDELIPWLTLAGGLLVSFLLFFVLYAFALSRARAIALADEITRELRESEANLAHAQALARLGSWTLDLSTQSMSWSAETYRILEMEPDPAGPTFDAFLAWLREEDRAAFKQAAVHSAATGVPCSLEFQLHLGGDQLRWAHYLLQPLAAGGAQLRGTVMDVTERKRALEAQRGSAVQIRDLLRRLVSVQEAERRRIAANLHDLVGQGLSVLGIALETVRNLLPGAVLARAEPTIRSMGQLLKDTMGSVREVMADLRPPLLDDYGLYAAIEWHARQLQERTGLPIDVEGGKLEPRPPAEVEMALFRIAQEALTNVAKHAAASGARITLSAASGRVRLVVEDDGCGIAAAPAANDSGPRGWGMATMRERAAAVGGAVRIEHPERGTRIVVEVGGDPHHPG